MEAPGPLVVARNPSANVPVCVFTSVAECVLRRAHSVGERRCVKETACVSERPCVRKTACVKETPSVSERPCVTETACVRSRYDREMAVGMRETATACPSESVMARCVSVMARRSACVKWRRRRHQMRDKGRVAAVAVSRTVPDSHGSARDSCRASHEAATCAPARVRSGPETPTVDVSRSRGRTEVRLDSEFGSDGFSRQACM